MRKLQKLATKLKMHEKDMYPAVEKFLKTKRIVDAQINRLVYNLYGLTKEEIEVVEELND